MCHQQKWRDKFFVNIKKGKIQQNAIDVGGKIQQNAIDVGLKKKPNTF